MQLIMAHTSFRKNEIKLFLLYFSIFFTHGSSGENINGLDDSVLFRLNWPGSSLAPTEDLNSENSMIMTTNDKEQYKCILPTLSSMNKDESEEYDGPSALELLQPLFSQLSCSYRLEQYWTYELCHGKYIKQYHEEKDPENPKKVQRQEFLLGEYNIQEYINELTRKKDTTANEGSKKISTKKIDGQQLPYLEITMPGGTMCDLNQKERITRVKYICYPDSKHEIYSFEEVSTCEYEVIVLTPFLCRHPDYRLKETVQNDIKCHPLEGSPSKPLQLVKIELENLQFSLRRRKEELLEVLRERTMEEARKEEVKTTSAPTPNDDKLVKDFLSGEYCLNGGSGWWKFDYCHGKKVDQYHEEKDGRKTVVNLGNWNKDKHLQWLQQNPHKRPKKGLSQKQISQFYSDGSLCDLNGRPRHVEVKLKCKENVGHINSVSLYLLEPKPCEYILVVESSILCSLVDSADENGLFNTGKVLA